MDDPLFLWTAHQIAQHPFDPFGFSVAWGTTTLPMWQVTKNPPLGSYYIALIASFAGWSEKALHVAFLLPALVVVLGTYRLAQRFTRAPLLAAAAFLLTPGFLVSSTNLMCDTMMLAFWITATILWIEGLERERPSLLIAAGLLIALCALTKYFGIALVPLLLVYTLARRRRHGEWLWYFAIPVLLCVGYQLWARHLYGSGLLGEAVRYVLNRQEGSLAANTIVGMSFLGGCAVSGLVAIPLIWTRKFIVGAIITSALVGLCIARAWFRIPADAAHQHWTSLSVQAALFVLSGLSIIAAAWADWRRNRDADSFLLFAWLMGTFVFATYINWAINARSVLPLIPAAGILVARRWERNERRSVAAIVAALVLAGSVSVWVSSGDAALADSEKAAALKIRDSVGSTGGRVLFQGHWGFQFYMESFDFTPYDANTYSVQSGDHIVIPENNTDLLAVPPASIQGRRTLTLFLPTHVATMSPSLGAGFYFAPWGPLPFSFGAVPPERYIISDLAPRTNRE
jgi:4-amino-4-deoxy-L-arabinose transferase-like glycosyltransferase